MRIALLFIIAQNCKQSKYPLTEQINSIKKECYNATQMNLTDIILRGKKLDTKEYILIILFS